MTRSKFRCPDLRIGRVSEPGRIYMITAVTFNRQPFFSDFETGRSVVHALKNTDCAAETYAFCVMPDHFHWLMQLREGYTLQNTVHFVKSIATKRIHQRSVIRRQIWSKGYYDHALRKEEAVKDCARYIVANPLRAGLVKDIGDYPLWDAIWL